MNDFRYQKTRVTLDDDRESCEGNPSVESLDTSLRGKVPPESTMSSEHVPRFAMTQRWRAGARQ